MIGGGGGAGLYSVGIARRLGVSRVIVPDVAAALSASRRAALRPAADLRRRDRGHDHRRLRPVGAPQRSSADLAPAARRSLAAAGSDASRRRSGSRSRRATRTRSGRSRCRCAASRLDDDDAARGAAPGLPRARTRSSSRSRDEDSPVELVTWRAHVRCALRHERGAGAARRAVCSGTSRRNGTPTSPGLGRSRTPVAPHRFDRSIGERLAGPLIVESPVTTVVLDPSGEPSSGSRAAPC